MDVNTFNLKMMTQLTAGFQETKNFNPRTREGCDQVMSVSTLVTVWSISIHAPVKGATQRLSSAS